HAGPFEIRRRTVERTVTMVVGGKPIERTESVATLTVQADGFVFGTTPEWDSENPPDLVRSLSAYLKASLPQEQADRYAKQIAKGREIIEGNQSILDKTFDQRDLLAQKEQELHDLRVALGIEKAVAAAESKEHHPT